jgi:hypothetical protein
MPVGGEAVGPPGWPPGIIDDPGGLQDPQPLAAARVDPECLDGGLDRWRAHERGHGPVANVRGKVTDDGGLGKRLGGDEIQRGPQRPQGVRSDVGADRPGPIVPVTADRSADRLGVEAGDLVADLTTGTRTGLGWALRAVPSPVARAVWWCALVDPVARRVVRGVRTHGTAGNGRHEWYGATDQHRIVAVRATLGGVDLGALADVWPPVRFGFGSAPRRPSVVAVTTTVRETESPAAA